MKIIWTREIPKKPGNYLVKDDRDGQIFGFKVTSLDLQAQKKDDTWLMGCYFSTEPFEEYYENRIG